MIREWHFRTLRLISFAIMIFSALKQQPIGTEVISIIAIIIWFLAGLPVSVAAKYGRNTFDTALFILLILFVSVGFYIGNLGDEQAGPIMFLGFLVVLLVIIGTLRDFFILISLIRKNLSDS